MDGDDFYVDHKYCPRCDGYVRYLRSPSCCYCVECGGPVRLFSTRDHRAFLRGLSRPNAFEETSVVS